ncbi:hypothetical protein HYH02_004685 [Chlamydomonas schloesseri]|uniref:Bulb-type lectin domain-containing protein n=1 Tax=Chlamydomonas schloesseri TaxID=2026947 RepID=A0A835WNS2_9CHLO|nr:hypothetical protein HYH02_004685 [Chlamydomonas schloesseri]|eukprot:KAG2450851.1 hypothetical protein HYH02_004685 [Chlamydomonas schloesseri]
MGRAEHHRDRKLLGLNATSNTSTNISTNTSTSTSTNTSTAPASCVTDLVDLQASVAVPAMLSDDVEAVPISGGKNRTKKAVKDGGLEARSATFSTSDTLSAGWCITTPRGTDTSACRTSSNRKYSFCIQSDGNIVLYDGATKAIWATGTNGKAGTSPHQLCMQTDGNLVGYNSRGQPFWASNTVRSGGSRLVMQNDGNVVLYDSRSAAYWSTDTWGGTSRARITLMGGQRSDLAVRCSSTSWRCYTTYDKSSSAGWVRETGDRLRLARTNLCLNLWGGGLDVNLYPCDPFGWNSQWTARDTMVYTYNRNALWWDGDGAQLKATGNQGCLTVFGRPVAWQCQWWFNWLW